MRHARRALYRASTWMLPALARNYREAARSVGIIMAHGVHDSGMSAMEPAPSSSIPLEAFEANIRGLMRGYRFVPLARAVESLEGGEPVGERCLVLTFDDSLQSLAHLVAPRLAAWGVPATFYLSTGVIDAGDTYWWLRLEYAWRRLQRMASPGVERLSFVVQPDGPPLGTLADIKLVLKKMPAAQAADVVLQMEAQAGVAPGQCRKDNPHAAVMSWADVRTLRDLGMSIGCHTVNHPDLAVVDTESLRAELELSKRRLESESGRPCLDFCFPFGSVSHEVVDEVRRAGFRSAVTTVSPGWNACGADVHRLRRFPLSGVPHRTCFELSGLRQAS